MLAANIQSSRERFSLVQLADAYMEVLPRAMREIRKVLRSSRGADLSVPQYRVLANLRRQAKTNKDLSDHIGLSAAAMSRLVLGLAKQGLLEKTEGLIDRRQNLLTLSKKGRSVIEEIRALSRQEFASRFRQLNSGDQKKLQEGLSVLAALFPFKHHEGEGSL